MSFKKVLEIIRKGLFKDNYLVETPYCLTYPYSKASFHSRVVSDIGKSEGFRLDLNSSEFSKKGFDFRTIEC